MSDVVYAENSSLSSLAPENTPESLQLSFENEIQKKREIIQKCSEDSFVIKTALNEIKKSFQDDTELFENASKLEKMSVEELKAYNEEQSRVRKADDKPQESDENADNLQSYALQLLLQAENKKELADAGRDITTLERYAELSRNYGDDFSRLYQIKQSVETDTLFSTEEERNGHPNASVKFAVIDMPRDSGIIAQAEKLRQDALGGVSSTLSLNIEIEGGVPFSLSVKPFDEQDQETQKKIQLSFSEQAIQQLTSESEKENKAKIEKIYKFCADHGISTADMTFPKDMDGLVQVDEKLKSLMAQVREKINEDNAKAEAEANQRREEEMKRNGLERGEDDEFLPTKDEVADMLMSDDQGVVKNDSAETIRETSEDEVSEGQENESIGTVIRGAAERAGHVVEKVRKAVGGDQKAVTDVFEDMIENDLGRIKKRSYFKRKTGSWTAYTLYDRVVKHNVSVEQDKDGNIRYNYALKLFVKQDEDGVVHLSYRVPNGKKLDEFYAGAIAGKLKDLKVTHFRIPKGWRADDIGMWRKALAEKGIVPVGISIDRSKAEAMLEVAKKKLSTEDYNRYKYRLGKQMLEHNRMKGKHLSPSEQGFIDGLIASRRYGAFITAYSDCLKSKIRRNLRTTTGDYSAVEKIANFRSLRRLYDIYKECMGRENILSSNILTAEEKRILGQEGNRDLLCNVRDLRPDQVGRLFDILQGTKDNPGQSQKEIEQKLDTALSMLYNPPAGRRRDTRPARTIINQILTDEKDACKDIFDDLVANGQDELKLVETVGNLAYDYEAKYPSATNSRIGERVSSQYENAPTKPVARDKAAHTNTSSGIQPIKGISHEM